MVTWENLDVLCQITAVLFTAFGGWYLHKPNDKHKWGCLLSLASEPFWIFTTVYHSQWFVLPLTFYYAGIWSKGLYHHVKERANNVLAIRT